MSCTFKPDLSDEHHKLADLKKGVYLTLIYCTVEFATGILTNSLAMTGDSFHMFTDTLALMFTYWAYKLRSVGPGNSPFGYLSFGWLRLELVATITNVLLVGGTVCWIIWEAYGRLRYGSSEIVSLPMFLVAITGFVVNITIFRKLHAHSHSEDGIKSAIACALTDAVSPLIVMAGAAIIVFNPRLYWIDSLAAIAIAGLLTWSFRELPPSIAGIILEATPTDIDYDRILEAIRAVDGVEDVSDLHIRKVGSGFIDLTAHIRVRNHDLHDTIPVSVRNTLKDNFPELGNFHQTVEVECFSNPA